MVFYLGVVYRWTRLGYRVKCGLFYGLPTPATKAWYGNAS